MTVTLINPFVVPAEMSDEEFMDRWHEVSDYLPDQPGFIDAHFHRNIGVVDKTFRFINVAKWESAEAYVAAAGRIPRRVDTTSGISFNPGLFEMVLDHRSDGS